MLSVIGHPTGITILAVLFKTILRHLPVNQTETIILNKIAKQI